MQGQNTTEGQEHANINTKVCKNIRNTATLSVTLNTHVCLMFTGTCCRLTSCSGSHVRHTGSSSVCRGLDPDGQGPSRNNIKVARITHTCVLVARDLLILLQGTAEVPLV